jgi:PKD repeat protein
MTMTEMIRVMEGRVMAVLAVVLVTGGCGNGSSSSADADADPEVDAGELTVPDAEPDVEDDGEVVGIEIRLEPSRTGGVAPLAVFFDATATEAEGVDRPLHELHFGWDFGDAGAPDWSTTGRSANAAVGGVGAHVYETPGEYTVTLTVRDGSGGVETAQVTIEVDDPDEVFTGTGTVCVSTGTDFGGCPDGAEQVTTDDFAAAMSHAGTGIRLLLKRGDVWTTSSVTQIDAPGPAMVGAFGTGDAPLIENTVDDSVFRLSSREPELDDWRFVDLAFDLGDSTGASTGNYAYHDGGTIRRLLVLRNEFFGGFNPIVISESILDYWNGEGYPQEHHDANAFVGCHGHDNFRRSLGHIGGRRLMILGNLLEDTLDSHVLRVTFAHGAVISDNDFGAPGDSFRHTVKIHGPLWEADGAVAWHQYTEQVIFSDNVIHGSCSWPLSIGPENDHSDERVRDVVVERNVLTGDADVQCSIHVAASAVTLRNNIVDLTGQAGSLAVTVHARGIEPPPEDVAIFNNTLYRGDAGDVDLDVVSGTTVMNNILFASDGSADPGCSGAGCSDNVTDDPLLEDPAGDDYTLQSGSPALDAGVPVPVLDDFTGNARPQGGAWDAGAHEMPG